MLWTRDSDWNLFNIYYLGFFVCLAFERCSRGKELDRPTFDNDPFVFNFRVSAGFQIVPTRQLNPIFRCSNQDVEVFC